MDPALVEALKEAHGLDLRKGLRDLALDALACAAKDGSWIAFDKLVDKVLILDDATPQSAPKLENAQERLQAALERLPPAVRKKVLSTLLTKRAEA